MNYELYRRAQKSIAQASLTNSKRPEVYIKGVTPTHAVSGNGAYLITPDNKKLIDFTCALGTNLFGYGNSAIVKAISDQAKDGWLYSLGSKLEVEAAEMIKDHFQFVDKVRFVKSGTEACMAAIKIARAHTGKTVVLSAGYHGWSDDFVSLTPPGIGVPKRDFIKSFESFDQITSDVACVIVEPVITDWSESRMKWLNELSIICKSKGVVLIFDEIITGFRWPKLCVSLWSGVTPDIILLGKACASGLPLGVIGLKSGIGADKEWFVSGSYSGEMLSLSAMKAVFKLLKDSDHNIDDLWQEGEWFIEEMNSLYPDKIVLEGYPTRGVFKGDPHIKALFWQECHKAGILFGPSWFFGFQHRKLRDQVVNICKDIVTNIKLNKVKLEGEMPSSPFAERIRK